MNKTILKTTTILTSLTFLTFASLSYASPRGGAPAPMKARAIQERAMDAGMVTTQPLTPAQNVQVAIDSGDVMTTQPLTPKQQIQVTANENGIGLTKENVASFKAQESGQVTTQPVGEPSAPKPIKARVVKEAAIASGNVMTTQPVEEPSAPKPIKARVVKEAAIASGNVMTTQPIEEPSAPKKPGFFSRLFGGGSTNDKPTPPSGSGRSGT